MNSSRKERRTTLLERLWVTRKPGVIVGCAALFLVPVLAFMLPSHLTLRNSFSFPMTAITHQRILLKLPSNITKIHINIGPNTNPIRPPEDDKHTAVIVVEPYIAIANQLRERIQKVKHPSRFFVISAAVAGPPLAGGISTFHHYNKRGLCSSLSQAQINDPPAFANQSRPQNNPSLDFGPGPSGIDFVPVISFETLLRAIPPHIEIPFVKTDTQGYDLAVIKSASRPTLRRVKRFMTETFLGKFDSAKYEGVKNDLRRDWIPYMAKVGYLLENPTDTDGHDYDAFWIREH